MRRLKVLLSIFLFLSLALPSTFVFAAGIAQSSQLQSANDALQKTINETQSAQEQEDTRMALLEKVLEITELEIDELGKSLEGLTLKNKDLIALQSVYQIYLEEAQDQLQKFKVRFEEGEKLDIALFAEEMKQWRSTYYDPANQQIFAFFLVPRLENALQTATERAEKIRLDLQKNRESFDALATAKLNALLEDARADIALAQEKYLKAKEILIQQSQTLLLQNAQSELGPFAEIAQSILFINSGAQTSTISESESTELNTKESTGLLEEALSYIKNAYQKFLSMSRLARSQIQTK